ncbi:hypothetical protein CSUI_001672, partial [Cystoisospora suis]
VSGKSSVSAFLNQLLFPFFQTVSIEEGYFSSCACSPMLHGEDDMRQKRRVFVTSPVVPRPNTLTFRFPFSIERELRCAACLVF